MDISKLEKQIIDDNKAINYDQALELTELPSEKVLELTSLARKVTVKYEDENGDLQEGHLDGMISRIFQHEYDHMLGRTFTEYASKMKLDMAYKKAEKEMDKWKRYQKALKAAQKKSVIKN